MNAPATSQPFPAARPPRPAALFPRSARAVLDPVPLPVPDLSSPPALLRHPRVSSLGEVAAGVLLLALWAWLWSMFLAGVVSPGARMAAADRPAAVTAPRIP